VQLFLAGQEYPSSSQFCYLFQPIQ